MNTVTVTMAGLTVFGIACILFSRLMGYVIDCIRKACEAARERRDQHDKELRESAERQKEILGRLKKIDERQGQIIERLSVLNDKILIVWEHIQDLEKVQQNKG